MSYYSNTVIYKIECKDKNIKEVFIGSALNFSKRVGGHQYAYNDVNNRDHNNPLYKFIRQYGGWDNWESIELMKYPECRSDKDRLEKERMFVTDKEHPNLNHRHSRKYAIKVKSSPIQCDCGGSYTPTHKTQHSKTMVHQTWLHDQK